MKSFAAILVLALTAMAGAQPDRDYDRYRYNDQTRENMRRPGEWAELATATPTRYGTEWINVGHDVGRFSQLRIVATEGRVAVRRVMVLFADGGKRVYRLDRTLGGRHDRDVLLRLDGERRISQVVVTTDRDIRGEYAVYGS